MTYKITRELQLEMYQTVVFFNKEAKKIKELRDQMRKLEELLRKTLDTQATAQFVDQEKGLCVSYLTLYTTLFQCDISKVVDQCVKTLRLLLQGSTLLSQVLPSELDPSYANQRNMASLYVNLLPKMIEQFGQKNSTLILDFIRTILLYSNDCHLEEMKTIFSTITKLYLANPTNVTIRQIRVLFIQVVSQKYAMFASTQVKEKLPEPFLYSPIECEMLYQNDYKSFVMTVVEMLSTITACQTGLISMEQTVQQLALGDISKITNGLDTLSAIITDDIYWLLRLVPLPALQDPQIRMQIEKLYHKILAFVIQTQNWAQQEAYLSNIETLFRTFLHQFGIQFIFEHFNNFIKRCLAMDDIPYYQLKAAVLAHLIRLACCDLAGYQLDAEKDKDYEAVIKSYQLVNYITKQNCGDVEQKGFFSYLQRVFMPPGYLLQLLYLNYDARFTQPNLVKDIFRCVLDQYQKLPEQTILLEREIAISRLYQKVHIATIGGMVRQLGSDPFATELNRFSHACGIIDVVEGKWLNQEFETSHSQRQYRLGSYQMVLLHTMARLQSELVTTFLRFQYNTEEVKFEFDFGFSQHFDDPEAQAEFLKNVSATQKMKAQMEIGFNKFTTEPLKALEQFRNLEFIPKLVSVKQDDEPSSVDSTISTAVSVIETLEAPVVNPDGTTRRRRRTFEEEFQYNLGLVGRHLQTYTNSSDAYEKIIQFVLKYIKKSEYSVGLSKEGFGELIGGSKIENKACLYYFCRYFSQKHLAQPKTPFVQALRSFLNYFMLPGEGQVIDRIVSFFSKAYADNAGMDHKTIHGLAYAVIMLNTDLHNASMKDRRMSKEVFVANTKLIDYAKQLDDKFLGDIYDDIAGSPFTLSSIEEMKKKFYIMAKYITIDEKKPDDQQQQQQTTSQEDDKEAEIIKTWSKNQRYSRAFLEWIQYGSTYHNRDMQDSILETQDVNACFSYQLFASMIESLGSGLIGKLLEAVRRYDSIPTVQTALKLNILLILSKYIRTSKNNIDLPVRQINAYIETSQFLSIPILQFKSFDMRDVYEQIVNKDSLGTKITSANVPVLRQQQIDLIMFLVSVAYLRSFPCKSYNECYSGALTIMEAWTPIMEVFSRIKYYNILVNKQIPRDARNQLQPTHTLRDYSTLLWQDIDGIFQKVTVVQGCQQTLINVKNLCTEFYGQDLFGKADQTIQCAIHLNQDEMQKLTVALSNSAIIELEVRILPAYCLNSSSQLNNLLTNLIQTDMHQFEVCFGLTFSHYQEIFVSKIPNIPENGFQGVAQVIGAFLGKQQFVSKARDEMLHHLEETNPIWLSIFSPLNLCLAPDSSTNLIWSVLEQINGYMQYYVFNGQQLNAFLQNALNDTSVFQTAEEFAEQYYGCLDRCILPKVTIQLAISICHQAVDKLKQRGKDLIYKDVTLDLQARQKLVQNPNEIKNPMARAQANIVMMENIILLLIFQVNEGRLEVNQTSQNLLKTYLMLINNLRTQLVVPDISELVQPHFFSFISRVTKLFLKTGHLITEGSRQVLTIFTNETAEILENICTDERPNIRRQGQESALRYFSELIKVEYAQETMIEQAQQIISRLVSIFSVRQNTDRLPCSNLSAGKFICDCEHYQKHCFVELAVPHMVPSSAGYTETQRKIAHFTFAVVLKASTQYHAPSLQNVLCYMLDNMLQHDSQFLFDRISCVSLVDINFPDYIDILRKFLNDSQAMPEIALQALPFCCKAHCQLTEQMELPELDKLFAQIITVYDHVAHEVQREAGVVEAMATLFDGFVAKFFNTKKDLIVFALKFFQQMDAPFFAECYKKRIFSSVTQLVLCESAEIRKELAELLRCKYDPQ